MRVRVVYESIFGNTQAATTAIARGLQEFAEVDVVNVADATPDSHSPVDLLVVGGPTHAFGMSRRQTRQDAADRVGGPFGPDENTTGIREWLEAEHGALRGTRAAAFATKLQRPSWLPGSAARGIGRQLRRQGFVLVRRPIDFYVVGMTGPLAAGEFDRAKLWAQRMASAENDRRARQGR
ncbi:hypothetical protein HGA13_07800 [Nocardia speluncae]|uniref:Flavodoxin-like domain-containing protein n=1 Tax=Nocardia speluncae TaxID=419477 RepID=A0A846XE31_9NOCA|nr:hypothetical protein [Nocardia speluncae]NKY32976.1 hypothetical protein [Nocardia speluncae]